VQDLQNRLGFWDARKEMIRDAIVVSASMGVVGKAGRGGTGGGKATLPVVTDLEKVSFNAVNGVETIYSPKVTVNAGEVIFDDFAVGTSKGFIGYGPDGASELVRPVNKAPRIHSVSKGAKTVTLKGYYASEEGAALGGGKVSDKFSFIFQLPEKDLETFLKGLVVSHPSSVSKQLKSLNVSGYGGYIPLSSDPELGQGVYEIYLDGCALKIFEKGAAIKSDEKNVSILYSDILKFTSHLSAAVFSKASANQNVHISMPLEIHLSESVVVLEVQLQIYSRVLIVLNDMWRGDKK